MNVVMEWQRACKLTIYSPFDFIGDERGNVWKKGLIVFVIKASSLRCIIFH